MSYTANEELCPMCHKHPIIIRTAKQYTKINNRPVSYNESYCYCSTLGENDPDAYFIPAKMMDENLKRARKSYEDKYGKLP